MFIEQTYEVMKKRILDKFPMLLDKREGSYSDTLISPLVEELAKAYISMGDILNLGFIEDNFDAYLDKRVGEFGIYRKQGTKSTGEILVEGKDGVTINNGSQIIFNDLKYVLLNDIELPTTNIGYVEAVEVGKQYNLLVDTEFKLIEADSNITLLKANKDFKGGLNIETDEELRKRFVKVVNNPSTSGNKSHYEEWALEVNGVSRATVYPLWNGNGTVKVMCVGSDNKPLETEIINNVKTYIDEVKPIGCTLTVTTPSLLNVTINASIELNEGHTIEEVKSDFEVTFNEYLKGITNELVYSKVYGVMVNMAGVEDITHLTLNDSTYNITIATDKIVNIQDIQLTEVF